MNVRPSSGYAEHGEVVVGDRAALDAFGAAFVGEIERRDVDERHPDERAAALAPLIEIRIVDAGLVEIPARRFFVDVDEPR